MRKTALLSLSCIFFWCYFTSAQALTLSEIELKSYLNQPLDARVMLSNVSPSELESLEVRFVQPPVSSAGVDIALTAEVVGDDAMGKYIQISSKQIIREPVVTFTLEMSWAAGRIQREYSLLLDPKN